MLKLAIVIFSLLAIVAIGCQQEPAESEMPAAIREFAEAIRQMNENDSSDRELLRQVVNQNEELLAEYRRSNELTEALVAEYQRMNDAAEYQAAHEPPTPSAPAMSASSEPVPARPDICGRSMIVQNAIARRFSANLCNAISVDNLDRFEGLEIDVSNKPGHTLAVGDFSDMSNLTNLIVKIRYYGDYPPATVLPAGVFAPLVNLRTLKVEIGSAERLPHDAIRSLYDADGVFENLPNLANLEIWGYADAPSFRRLPNLRNLEIDLMVERRGEIPAFSFEENASPVEMDLDIALVSDSDRGFNPRERALTLPNNMVTGANRLRTLNLDIWVENGGDGFFNISVDTFDGLSELETLEFETVALNIPRRSFEDLVNLRRLYMPNCCDLSGSYTENEIFVADYRVAAMIASECDECPSITGVLSTDR